MIPRLAMVVALCVPVVGNAQGFRVSGSVVRAGGRDPVPGAVVVLHRIGGPGEGPVDSARTTARGNYRFVRPDGDSAALLFTSVHHDGVAYVSAEPARSRGVGPVRIPPIVLYDTSSAAPVGVAQRQLLVRGPDRDGSRAVLDLISLRNPGTRTRVAADGPTWRGRLLEGAVEALLPGAESDVSGDATRIRGDSIAVTAPIPPGDRQIGLSYIIPASRRLALYLDQPVAILVLMVADTAAEVAPGAVAAGDIRVFEGERYRRFEGADLAAGDSIVITLPRGPLRFADLWWLVVVSVAGVLGAAAAKWWRAPLAERTGNP